MIKLTFKNVGQGDSIIIEWEKDNSENIIIIDCKRAFGTNPVLDHIKSKGYKRIKMLLLSHPHSDHCSGFSELINYCIANDIIIDHFVHTSNNMPSFWRMANLSNEGDTELLFLFKILRVARDKMGLKFWQVQGEAINNEIEIGFGIKIKVFAPTSVEYDNYALGFDVLPIEEEAGNKPSANWLSSFIKLYSGDWFILLSSDVEKSVLTYYGKKHPEMLKGKLILGQAPHHGAFRNHSNTFWRNLNYKERIPIVFSVGKNSYGHPSENVVKYFNREKFDIYSTNQVGALNKTITAKSKNNATMLDTFSMAMPSQAKNKLNGDQVFTIDTSGLVRHS